MSEKAYLIDTNVISELRKGRRANPGVRGFFNDVAKANYALFISAITIGELRRGVELIRYRGDTRQARKLESWLGDIVEDYADNILEFTATEAQVWGHLRVSHHENAIDKQIAATALTYDLTLVTRNTGDFDRTGICTLNPFLPEGG